MKTIKYYAWYRALKSGYDIILVEFNKGDFRHRIESFYQNVKTNSEALKLVEKLNCNL